MLPEVIETSTSHSTKECPGGAMMLIAFRLLQPVFGEFAAILGIVAASGGGWCVTWRRTSRHKKSGWMPSLR